MAQRSIAPRRGIEVLNGLTSCVVFGRHIDGMPGVAACFVEAAVLSLFQRQAWWLVGSTCFLDYVRERDSKAYDLASEVLRADRSREARLSSASKLAEYVTCRNADDSFSTMGH